MPSLQVLEPALDRRLVTPARLSEIVGYGGAHEAVDSIIGPVAEAADATAALEQQKRFIDMAAEKAESVLCGRTLCRQRYRSWQAGSNMHELELPQWPVEAEALEVSTSRLSADADAPSAVSKDDYRLADPGPRYVYRGAGWPTSTWSAAFTAQAIAGSEYENYRTDFTGGYLMPGSIAAWVADESYITGSSSSVGAPVPDFGSWIRPSDPSNRLRFECTTAGTTASSEPSWPTALPWTPATVYSTGDWALATNGPVGFWMEATTGGTSDATEPGWPVLAGETVAEDPDTLAWTVRAELTFAEGPDTLVWTGHFAEELPLSIQDAMALLAIALAKKIVGQPCEKGEDPDARCMDLAKSLRRLAA